MTETKPESSTQAKAEAIVADAFAKHGHAARDPNRHLRPRLVTAPGSGRVDWPQRGAVGQDAGAG